MGKEFNKKKRWTLLIVLLSLFSIKFIQAATVGSLPTIDVSFRDYETECVYITEYKLFSQAYPNETVALECLTDCSGCNLDFRFKPKSGLSNDNYTFMINAEDRVGNAAMITNNFTVYSEFMKINLVYPQYGFASTTPFNITINTSKKAVVCTYYGVPGVSFFDLAPSPTYRFQTNEGFSHISSDYAGSGNGVGSNIYIKCNDTAGINNNRFPQVFRIGFDKTPPSLNTYASPPRIIEPPYKTKLYATSEDEIFCLQSQTQNETEFMLNSYINNNQISYNDFKTNFSIEVPIDQPNIARQITYYIQCINRAKLFSERKAINVIINESEETKIAETRPSGFINNQTPDLYVKTNKKANCNITNGNNHTSMITSDNNNHYVNIRGKLGEGNYSFPVLCYFHSGGQASETISFTVDITKPQTTFVSGKSYTCSDKGFTNKLNFSAPDSSGISKYYYQISGPSGEIIKNWTTTSVSEVNIQGLTLKYGSVYNVVVKAVDNAGNIGDVNTFKVEAQNESTKSECKDKGPPSVDIKSEITTDGLKIWMECSDENGCTTQKGYLISFDSPCQTCAECTNYLVDYYKPEIVRTAGNYTFCYSVLDGVQNNATGQKTIYYNGSVLDNPYSQPTPITPIDDPKQDIDADRDGMLHDWEVKYASCGLSDVSYKDRFYDFDNDGSYNLEEYQQNTDPCQSDTDNDSFFDGAERTSLTDPNQTTDKPVDSDLDGIDDQWEIRYFTNIETINATTDYDQDNFFDLEEYYYNADPTSSDSDFDGLTDFDEVKNRYTWPTEDDTDGDGYSDNDEIQKDSDPLDPSIKPDIPADTSNQPEISEEDVVQKANWLALMLIILGVLMTLSGSGYLGYTFYEDEQKRKKLNTQKTTTSQQKTQNISPAQFTQQKPVSQQTKTTQTPMPAQRIVQKPQVIPPRKTFDLNIRRKVQKRKSFLSGFESSSREEQKETSNLSLSEFSKPKTLTKLTGQKKMVYPAAQAIAPTIITKKSSQDTTFNELDLLVDNKNNINNDSDKLDNLISSQKNKTTNLDELSSNKISSKDAFSQLSELAKESKGQDIMELTQKNKMNKEDIIKTLNALASQPKLLDLEVLKVVLSKLLETSKISKTDISGLLFDMEEKGAITKQQLLTLLKELRIQK